MNNYAIIQSKEEINYTYSRLVDKLNQHVKLLSEDKEPFTSIMAMIRGLRKLNLDYLQEMRRNEVKLKESELLLADKVHKIFKVDVVPSIEIGLFGEQQMKKVLVRHEYSELAKKGIKYKEIKVRLSKKYEVSVSWIEKLVYRKTPLSGSSRTSPRRGELPTHRLERGDEIRLTDDISKGQ